MHEENDEDGGTPEQAECAASSSSLSQARPLIKNFLVTGQKPRNTHPKRN